MGERTSHAPGAFSWTDLGTTDPDGAKRFYGALFGWEYEDQPIPGGGTYSTARKNGLDVAGLSRTMEGMPTAWNSYVTVESADATAAAAGGLGGTTLGGPFDVTDAGRMAVVGDPTGAVLCVWEPRANIGASLVNAPGALTLNQLNTDDPGRAQEFYTRLFGWRFEQVQGGEAAYWGVYRGERLNAGMMQMPPGAGAPSHWLVYFGSENADADASRGGELGGQVMVPPLDVPGGRIVVARDPQGAVFGTLAGRFDD
jgi:predicted enzyme related to lactoylglutathione lyase